MKIEINAEKRGVQGTGASRRLRRANRIPGIVYGGGRDAQPISMDHNELYHKLKLEAFHASILDMNLGGEKVQVLLRDFQMHPFRPVINHMDFQRVAEDREIHMKVPLHFRGEELSPGVKTQGGLVSHVMNELEIICLPKDLPEFIEVDLSGLSAGHSVHVADLKLPAGVRASVLNKGENPTVATLVIKGEAAEDESTGPTVAAADIATTTQKKKEDAPQPKKDDKKKDDKKK
jgi:large subunit ribosomal protein L25